MYDYRIVNTLHEDRVRNSLRRFDLNHQSIITRPALPRQLLSALGTALVAFGTRLQPDNPPTSGYHNRLRKA